MFSTVICFIVKQYLIMHISTAELGAIFLFTKTIMMNDISIYGLLVECDLPARQSSKFNVCAVKLLEI